MLLTLLAAVPTACTDKKPSEVLSVGNRPDRSTGGTDGGTDAGSMPGPTEAADASTSAPPSHSDGIDLFPGLDGGRSQDAAQDMFDDAGSDPAAFAAVCLVGGSAQAAPGVDEGSCEAPVLLDLSGASYGDVVYVDLPGTLRDLPLSALGKCGAQAERAVAVQVRLPGDADLEASIDAATGVDGTLRVFEQDSSSCPAGAPLACVDDTSSSGCEYLRVRAGSFSPDADLIVVVSEQVSSGRTLTLRLRVQDPRTGS